MAQLKFIGIFLAVLLVGFVAALIFAAKHFEKVELAGGSIEAAGQIANCVSGARQTIYDYTASRSFVIELQQSDDYRFLQGQPQYESFVAQNIGAIRQGGMVRIGTVVIASLITGEGTYYGGFDQSLEMAANRHSVAVLAYVLAGLYLLLAAALVVASHFVFKPVGQAFQLQRDFIHNASHELNTPIAVIGANGAVLKAEQQAPSPWLETILSETEHMRCIVSDLLELVDADSPPAPPEPVELSALALNHLLAFDALAYERGVNYEYEVQPGLVVQGSEKSLRQLLTHLTDNAFKYVGGGQKQVRASLLQKGNEAVFTLRNSGCNIRPEEKEKIFDRFYRSQADCFEGGSTGSGIGLSIVRGICLKYGYWLTLELEPGEWTEFSVAFKL